MAQKKMVKKQPSKERVEVSKERKGSIRGREFDIYGKDGLIDATIEVDHAKESPPGKADVYLSQQRTYTDKGIKKTPIRLHRTKQDVAKKYPRISAKLPKLR